MEGFRPIYSEALFLDMEPADGIYEPLIGYIVLEQAQAAVDISSHRLFHIGKVNLKAISIQPLEMVKSEPISHAFSERSRPVSEKG
uniref:Uncharacterized protein n=1 Tax=Candidatus Kentrum sp. LFY TaxID=2126342 RepID=A0A450U706_9GAMM|nr:MAG: hypothetical protein BECKLFY1418A_GA0070994_1001123 [Candidatus Kentron sp. LFY]